jgi:hypothetical protein
MAFTFKISGQQQLKQKLDRAPATIRREVNRVARLGVETIARNAKRDAPKDQGLLNQQIVPVSNRDIHQVVAHPFYSPYMEFGTKSKTKIPAGLESYAAQFKGSRGGSFKDLVQAIAKWVRRKGIAGRYSTKTRRRVGSRITQLSEDYTIAYLIARKIVKVGVKPHPFLFPNFEKQKPIIIKDMDEVLKKVL